MCHAQSHERLLYVHNYSSHLSHSPFARAFDDLYILLASQGTEARLCFFEVERCFELSYTPNLRILSIMLHGSIPHPAFSLHTFRVALFKNMCSPPPPQDLLLSQQSLATLPSPLPSSSTFHCSPCMFVSEFRVVPCIEHYKMTSLRHIAMEGRCW